MTITTDLRAVEALETESVDEHVCQVAALLPFAVELKDKPDRREPRYSTYWIDLGSRGAADGPHDWARIGPGGSRPTWWIETADGETFEDSGLSLRTDPVRIAQWIGDRARALGCPAAQVDRPDWGTVSRWADAHKAVGAWPVQGIEWDAFHVEGDRCERAKTAHDCPRDHDYFRQEP